MTIKGLLLSTFGVLLLTAWKWARDPGPAPAKSTATPILVELFTSEGCSSCPPADRFLQKLDQQPVPGAEVVVLSEHVDYWNHIGWKDPYSAHSYSERQSAYSRRFDLDSVYTPQMVVDGASEFVGSNTAAADKALAKAKAVPKIAIHLSLISAAAQTVEAHVEAATLEPSFGVREAEVYIVLALNHAESQVSAGENAGHKLEHVAVVRNLTKLGIIKQSHSFSQDVQLHVEPGFDSRNLRLVAFVQEPRQGRVLGAARLPISAN